MNEPTQDAPAHASDSAANPPYPEVPAGSAPAEVRTTGMLCHLLGLAGLLGIPFGNIIGPLVVWLVKKDESPFVDDQGKEAINFQITATIIAIAAAFSIIVIIGIFLLPAVLILWLIFTIVGAVKASNGEYYRYPFALRLVK